MNLDEMTESELEKLIADAEEKRSQLAKARQHIEASELVGKCFKLGHATNNGTFMRYSRVINTVHYPIRAIQFSIAGEWLSFDSQAWWQKSEMGEEIAASEFEEAFRAFLDQLGTLVSK